MGFHEQRLAQVQRALTKLQGNNAWVSSADLLETMSKSSRPKVLSLLVAAGYLERTGVREFTRYRVPEGVDVGVLIDDPVMLSGVLWPNEGFAVLPEASEPSNDDGSEAIEEAVEEEEAGPSRAHDWEEAPSPEAQLLVQVVDSLAALSKVTAHVAQRVDASRSAKSSSSDDLILEVAANLETKVNALEKTFEFFDVEELSNAISHAVAAAIANADAKVAGNAVAVAVKEAVSGELAKFHSQSEKAFSTLDAKIADISKAQDKRQTELGQAFKTLVDALGDHRKLDETARNANLTVITQAINLAVKNSVEEINKGRLAAKLGKTDSTLEEMQKRLDNMAESFEMQAEATLKLVTVYKDLSSTMAALIETLRPNEAARRGLALISTIPAGKKST